MSIEVQLRLVGAVLVGLGVGHVALPRVLAWRPQFASLAPLTRHVLYTHTFFIGVMCVLLGLAPLLLAPDLLAPAAGSTRPSSAPSACSGGCGGRPSSSRSRRRPGVGRGCTRPATPGSRCCGRGWSRCSPRRCSRAERSRSSKVHTLTSGSAAAWLHRPAAFRRGIVHTLTRRHGPVWGWAWYKDAVTGNDAVPTDQRARPAAPVLLLGGSLGSNLDMWRPNCPRSPTCGWCASTTAGTASRRCRRGPYRIEDLAGTCSRCSTGSASSGLYCGLSIGGMVGMWLAANAPGPHRAAGADVHLGVPAARRGWLGRAALSGRPAWGHRRRGRSALVHARFRAEHRRGRRRYRAMIAAARRRVTRAAARRSPRWTCARSWPDHRADAGDLGRGGPGHAAGARRADPRGIAGSRWRSSGAAHLANVEQAEAIGQLIMDHVGG